ncbi:hypothetical protein SKP52_02470 [Sphingopyxis fribergensis]|uniref:Uncharacterized protein n=1 Tax=Sphingopyxis fribergensis TaxID=1515612 RepID=A0A0A7PBV3_9SPHN|nr:hypothetical protein [Sphingopyxis fribergensis]AJA07429.1 hypothetical protein SKP52_02470 [Sphingopyxis fribergensis]
MPDNTSATFVPLVSREQAWNKFAAAIRLYAGRGRRYSFKQLANGAGVKDRVIECALHDPSNVDFRPMPFEAQMSIARFLGAEFTNEWFHLAGQGAFDLPDEDAPTPGELAADIATEGAEVVRMAADGVFCGEDRKRLRAIGSEKIERGQMLVGLTERRAA